VKAKIKKESVVNNKSLERLCSIIPSRIDCLKLLQHLYPDIMKDLNNISLTGRTKAETNEESTS